VIDVLLDARAYLNIGDTNDISPFEYAKMASNSHLPQVLERCTLSHGNSGPSSRTLTTWKEFRGLFLMGQRLAWTLQPSTCAYPLFIILGKERQVLGRF
jgi:hypothetical protein